MKPVPGNLSATRDALHQIAFFAVAPARYKTVARMGLRATPGGFGTPEFMGRVARVEGDLLVHEDNGQVATQTIGTIREAARFFGHEYEAEWFAEFRDPLSPADPDARLSVDEEAAIFLGNWFEFGFEILDRLRAHAAAGDDVTEVQLWPEHFDSATEMGDHEGGQRASYGASPGDAAHPEPYFYVAAWSEIDRSTRYWNDSSFNGASLGYEDIAEADDPAGETLAFLLEGYRILHGG